MKNLTDLVRSRGTYNKTNNSYHLSVRGAKLKIDGRIAEEYEDLNSPAPCLVTDLILSSGSEECHFKMCTAFSTSYILMSNDDYSLGVLSDSEKSHLAKYAKLLPEKNKINKTESNKIKLLKLINSIKHDYLPGISIHKHCDLNFAVDCIFCCFKAEDLKKNEVSQDAIRDSILNSIQKTEALFIRIQYPTRKALEESARLAYQSQERYARWKYIIELINDKVDSLITTKEINQILNKFSLIDNRLPGDEKVKIKAPKKTKFEVNFPDIHYHFYGEKSWQDFSWDERFEIADKIKKHEEKLLKKLDHPRFELKIKEEHVKYVVRQIENIASYYFYDENLKLKNLNPEYVNIYNCTTNINIPSDCLIFDHFEKKHYVFHDIEHFFSGNQRAKSLFMKIDDLMIGFDFAQPGKARKSYEDTFENFYEDHVIAHMNEVTSKSTNLKYYTKLFYARIDTESTRKLYGFLKRNAKSEAVASQK